MMVEGRGLAGQGRKSDALRGRFPVEISPGRISCSVGWELWTASSVCEEAPEVPEAMHLVLPSMLEVLEVMHRVLLCMLGVMDGELCLRGGAGARRCWRCQK